MQPLHPNWTNVPRPIIGMLHLLPLPGSPRFGGSMDAIRDALLRDAEALASGGVHGMMMENFGDVPFYPGRVPANVLVSMLELARKVKKSFNLPLGINVLRNDGQTALAIAYEVGADFIRVNVLCGARVTDQGIVQAIAHDLLRERAMRGATNIKILADVDVKHSAALAPRPIENEVEDTIHRGLADAVIVSGAGTGKATDPQQVQRVKRVAGQTPVLIGSGVDLKTVSNYRQHCDGFIVGTSLKQDGIATNPVDVHRVREFVRAVEA